MRIVVRRRPGIASQGLLSWPGGVARCALGKGGVTAAKREGDGATPIGPMRLLHGYYRNRPGRRIRSALPLTRIMPQDGWCDAPGDRNYNRPVRLPYPASAERMMRDDRLYDLVIVLDCNTGPRKRGRGSAIFFHLARPGFAPTEGCVAVAPRVMARLLPFLDRSTVLEVRR